MSEADERDQIVIVRAANRTACGCVGFLWHLTERGDDWHCHCCEPRVEAPAAQEIEMTEREIEIVRLVIQALPAPRDRYRRLTSDPATTGALSVQLSRLLREFGASGGGTDAIDQCRMVLQGLIGDISTDISR